jgi:cytoplasmic tRNA 2-thiolation protein 1
MASMEQQLVQNDVVAEEGLEIEITTTAPPSTVKGKKGPKSKHPARGSRKPPPRQTMGQCKRCGYLSSQDICKACLLLEGLNKNRPKNPIEVSHEGHDDAPPNTTAVATGIQQLALGAD